MKKWIIFGIAGLAAITVLGVYTHKTIRKRNENRCINRMRQLYSAAVSHSLSEYISPDTVVKFEEVTYLLREGMKGTTCPSDGMPYAPFSVLQGPICPNGHQLEPECDRPWRAGPNAFKLKGLYEAHGFTNLIDRAEHKLELYQN